jgi:hypothetical protein
MERRSREMDSNSDVGLEFRLWIRIQIMAVLRRAACAALDERWRQAGGKWRGYGGDMEGIWRRYAYGGDMEGRSSGDGGEMEVRRIRIQMMESNSDYGCPAVRNTHHTHHTTHNDTPCQHAMTHEPPLALHARSTGCAPQNEEQQPTANLALEPAPHPHPRVGLR